MKWKEKCPSTTTRWQQTKYVMCLLCRQLKPFFWSCFEMLQEWKMNFPIKLFHCFLSTTAITTVELFVCSLFLPLSLKKMYLNHAMWICNYAELYARIKNEGASERNSLFHRAISYSKNAVFLASFFLSYAFVPNIAFVGVFWLSIQSMFCFEIKFVILFFTLLLLLLLLLPVCVCEWMCFPPNLRVWSVSAVKGRKI